MIDPSSKIGISTRIQPTAIIEEGCEIGEGCFIGHYVVMRPRTKIGDNTVVGHLTVFEGDCSVGSGVLIEAQCNITKGAVIEDDVFIAAGFVGCNDDDMVHNRRHIKPFIVNAFTIKRAARIAAGVLVRPGVVIGENAMVGLGSVVTKNVAANTVVFGHPAKYVRMVDKDMII